MRRIKNSKTNVRVRVSEWMWQQIANHLLQDPDIEQMLFALARLVETVDGLVLIINHILLPDPGDLNQQSAAGVAPTQGFQSWVYQLAHASGQCIIDIHTHTHTGKPRFSGIDDHHGHLNAQAIESAFDEPTTMAMLVFGNDLTGHDAVFYDRCDQAFHEIQAIEILGRGCQIRVTEEPDSVTDLPTVYDRQCRIAGWNQQTLARQKVAIIGVGGTGSHVFQALLGMGVGTKGWIALIDHDDIEASNLSRLPYAQAEDVGKPKVQVAKTYAARRGIAVSVHAIAASVSSPEAQAYLRAATVIMGCADNDGARKSSNALAVRYLIPYIDLGCDIILPPEIAKQETLGSDPRKTDSLTDKAEQVGDDPLPETPAPAEIVQAMGQARIVLPGVNACLACCGGFDPSQAVLDLLSPDEKAARAAHGYADGHAPAPSVASLNALTAQHGVAALLSVVLGPRFGQWDYLHFNQFSGTTLTANTEIRDTCPLCSSSTAFQTAEPELAVSSTDHDAPTSQDAQAQSQDGAPTLED